MPEYVPVTRDTHQSKCWKRFSGYRFAADTSIAAIVGAEIALAARALPIGFVRNQDRFYLSAVLSLAPQRNLFVGPDGQWIGQYIPAVFRGHPFRILPNEANEPVLCVDEASGLVSGKGDGEQFFDADGNPSTALKSVIEFLQQIEASRPATETAVAALSNAGIIQKWAIEVPTPEGQAQQVEGLFCVNEAALNALSDEQFLALRKASALPIVYAQLLSMGELPLLQRLSAAHQSYAAAAPKNATEVVASVASLDKFFGMAADDTVQFKDNVNFKF